MKMGEDEMKADDQLCRSSQERKKKKTRTTGTETLSQF